jgi:hypothetical protein
LSSDFEVITGLQRVSFQAKLHGLLVKISLYPKKKDFIYDFGCILVKKIHHWVLESQTLKYLFSITLTLLVVLSYAQPHAQASPLPQVFLIGEYEERYLELSQMHPALFMSVYHNDIDHAYKAWMNCLMDMEDYATEINFDLKGVKLWLNLFFNADGTISNLAFYPKPNSRNVPEEDLIAFFKNFVRQYKLNMVAEKGFQHSTSASFPTFFQRDNPELAKRN